MNLEHAKVPPVLVPERDIIALYITFCDDENDIKSRHIAGVSLANANLPHISFVGCVFSKVRLCGCNLSHASFFDVVFEECDFSGCDFSESYFKRVSFTSCKCVGTNFAECSFTSLVISDSTFGYAILDRSNFKKAQLSDVDLRFSSIAECKLCDFATSKTCYTGANLFKTALCGIDFTSCEIDGLILSDTCAELRGATVRADQAAELARLLGVLIK
ncbi:MAG: pentapeptide repeat-containing protein [Clostridia bacterium]